MKSARYDVVIVGARVAGAAAGMLLARTGARVLVVDQAKEIGDTLSTHALMPPAVELLGRWGLLGQIVNDGAPVVRHAQFHYGPDLVTVDIRGSANAEGLIAPRRRLIDPMLLEAARGAGAEIMLGTRVEGCIRDDGGRVTGIVARGRDGTAQEIHAGIVVGADGRSGPIAGMVGADLVAKNHHQTAFVYCYVPSVPNQGYRWYFREGEIAGAIPTNDGMHCVFAGVPARTYAARFATDARQGVLDVLSGFDPEVAESIEQELPRKMYRFSGAPGHVRNRTGRGWALIGDAASFKDPSTAHGMTDALLDAQTLADSIANGNASKDYAEPRAEQVADVFDVSQSIATYDWGLEEVQMLHERLRRCIKNEMKFVLASTAPRDGSRNIAERPALSPAA